MTDHKKYCHVCQGVGQVDTGIDESPITICNQCNGTGLKAQRTWVGLTDEEIMDMYNEPRSDAEMIAFGREVEVKLKEKNNA